MDSTLQPMSIGEMKVSVIVPVYNAQTYLKECLNSICSQDYKNLEVIVVNDGSTDSSLEILQDYSQREPRLRVISIENQGVSVARNVALDNVTGDYVLMVDSDDVLRVGAVSALMTIADNTKSDLVSFEYEKCYRHTAINVDKPSNEPIENISVETFFKKVFDVDARGYVGGYIWARMYKASILGNIRFDKELKYYEDEKFFARLLASFPALKIVHLPQVLYYYRVRQSSLMKENRYSRLHILYRSQRVLKNFYTNRSVQYKILDLSRFRTLTKLVQIHLAQGMSGGLGLFRKVLISGKYSISWRKNLPYLLGRGIAKRYSVSRLAKEKNKKADADRFWP